MSFDTNSKTKTNLSLDILNKITRKHFGNSLDSYNENTQGFYNSIYELIIEGKSYMLKVAPGKEKKILTYEKDIIQVEIDIYKLMEKLEIPAPRILYTNYQHDIISSDYYIMTKIKGESLLTSQRKLLENDELVKKVFYYFAILHNQKATYFGYPHIKGSTMKEAYIEMMDALFNDAKRILYDVPSFVLDLYNLIKQNLDRLDVVLKPSILHFDLWDGNIMADGNTITGLIDTERSLNAENIMEFVGMHFELFNPKYKKYIEHYNQFADEKIILNTDTKIRYLMYQSYLYFLMMVESPYRDIDGSFDGQYNWAKENLIKIHNELQNLLN